MNEQTKKIDYEKIGKLLWHEGLGETLQYIASQTENKIDDIAIQIVDEIAEKVFPIEK